MSRLIDRVTNWMGNLNSIRNRVRDGNHHRDFNFQIQKRKKERKQSPMTACHNPGIISGMKITIKKGGKKEYLGCDT